MKKLITIFISLILVLVSSAFCFAAGELFEIDSYTGEILKTGTVSSTNYVMLSASCNYDFTNEMYVYTLSSKDGTTVSCSACDGMVVKGWAELEPSEAARIIVYHNGEVVPESDYAELLDPGTYTVRALDGNRELLSFTIVGDRTGLIYSYQIPRFFTLLDCRRNGQQYNAPGGFVDMTEEGTYYVKYRCSDTGVIEELTVTIDHTPPELEIYGVQNGIAKQKVTFGETEDHSSLVMKRNGEPIVISDELKTAGDYEITYTDEAGNSSVYNFTIRTFLDGGAWVFVGMTLILIGLAVGYMIYSRRTMRTR